MCLAVPGRILSIKEVSEQGGERLANVDFNGNKVDVSLAMVPEAKKGDYVLVHAGYALETLDQSEAEQTWEYLKEAGIEFSGQSP
jgi:hydrogenase expression/formation protein HypC